MMRYLMLGVLLGLLVTFPPVLAVVAAIGTALLSQPLLVAFALGAVARPHLPRGWAR
ncbi:hypothetical protein ABZ016_24015 [Streptomyces sp. NPDC006372]|uniref:hypothetical protein n=1 Tax=Streptomyces sp. NPDC006372 TaxID=3155599 RepID=UPI0033BCD2BA